MVLPFIHRKPTAQEVEKVRLLLSTFQDGSGMLAKPGGGTLPGWRDFERTVAAVFNGVNQENKFIFDVLLSDPETSVGYGISCKMRRELNRVSKDGRVTIELSNSSKKFKDYLNKKGISSDNYKNHAQEVGIGIIELVELWKHEVSIANGGKIDIDKSGYLALLYNEVGFYQLFWFRIHLPDPRNIRWYYPEIRTKNGQVKTAGHLNGDDGSGGRLFEWYSDSGGQLKYYPLATDALWKSERFILEPLSEEARIFGLLTKAKSYFPDQWDNTI